MVLGMGSDARGRGVTFAAAQALCVNLLIVFMGCFGCGL